MHNAVRPAGPHLTAAAASAFASSTNAGGTTWLAFSSLALRPLMASRLLVDDIASRVCARECAIVIREELPLHAQVSFQRPRMPQTAMAIIARFRRRAGPSAEGWCLQPRRGGRSRQPALAE